MRNIRTLIGIISIIGFCQSVFAQGYHVRIGTIGNSITQGVGLSQPLTQAYPVQLAGMLEEIYGDTCIVRNFGITSTTMLKKGDIPYWESQNFQDVMDYAPEICFILLGTNDSKPQNWDAYGDEYLDDYLSLIDTLKSRNPFMKFIVAYPPPAFQVVWGIRDSVINHGIIPAIDTVLSLTDAQLIDFYHPLLDSVYLFPDFIHPNAEGSRVMAEIIFDSIIATDIIHQADTGLTFITKFKSEEPAIALGNSTDLSWTTLNADTVWLNGDLVSVNGSITITPPDTTIYTLIAKGEKSSDTVVITQVVYIPELTRLKISPGKPYKYEGDTVLFKVFYFDQIDDSITDTTYAVDWEIIDGTGYLYGATDITVYFVAQGPDTTQLAVKFGDIADTAIIKIRALSGIMRNTELNELKIFPNPCFDEVSIQGRFTNDPVTVTIFDMKGVVHLQKTFYSGENTMQLHQLKINKLPEGSYIIKVENSGIIFTDKLLIIRN